VFEDLSGAVGEENEGKNLGGIIAEKAKFANSVLQLRIC
jgi:hypothetical protein